jgi:replicative DNA helicase
MSVAHLPDLRQPTGRLDGAEQPREAPHNFEAEQALLGAILFDNTAFERAEGMVSAHEFYEPFHARLFAAMADHIAKGQLAEPIVLMERFRRDPGFEELGGLRYLAELVDRAPAAFNAADYARVIRDLSNRRELIRISGEAAQGAATDFDRPAREHLEAAEQALFSIAETGRANTGPVTFAEALTKAVESTAAAYAKDGGLSGISTGLSDLDRLLGGLHGSDLVILAGRPSMGKTSLATNIAFHVARNYGWEPTAEGKRRTIAGGQVLFFSLEMSQEQLAARILADVSEVPSDKMRRGDIRSDQFGAIRDAAMEIQGAPLFIDDTGGLSIGQLAARARRQKRTTGLDLVVVDYLQLVTVGALKGPENRVLQVSMVTQGLKALAKELGVPVIALSQLSRNVENREDKRPQLSDLRESGSIEQDADVVAFIYREAYYLSRGEPREGTPEHLAWQDAMDRIKHQAEVIIGKQRHGPIGTVRLAFNEDLTRFGNLAREARWEAQAAVPYAEKAKPTPLFAARDPSGRD